MALAAQLLVEDLARSLIARGEYVATAESCTGGLIAAALTDVAGSSQWFERSFIPYANVAKTEMLGVRPGTLQHYGAVSEACVREMVAGALAHSHAHWALAVSGVAGPSGGTTDKPVGTVWFALAQREGSVRAWVQHFEGDRQAVRASAVIVALKRLIHEINHTSTLA